METPKTLTSLRFMRMIRDSKAMDSNLQAAQVDIAFRRAVSTSQRRNSDRSEEKSEPKNSRKRLQFNEFYDVINELARKKFAPQNDPALAGLNEEEKETWWAFKMLSEYLFPLLQRHEDRGRTAVTYPPRTPTPNPMTPIGNEELSIRPHQSILDTVDQELSSVEGVYGEAEKISRLEDLDTEIWDDINIEDGPMGLLYKYQDTLFSLFQMHATQDMQFRGGATSHDRSRIRSRSGDSTGSAGKKYRRHYIMGRHGFFAFVKKYRILHDLLSRVAVDNVFMSSSEDVSSNGSSLPCLTFKGFLVALMHCASLAYGRPEDGESTGDIAAGIDAMYRILFRIDPGGKNFKSLQKRYKSFQQKRLELTKIMQEDLASNRLRSDNKNTIAEATRDLKRPIESNYYGGAQEELESKTGEVKLSNPDKDAKKSIQKQNKRKSNRANVLKKSPMNGLAIQSILNDSERDENGKLKEDVMRLVREIFDHFSRGKKHTCIICQKVAKWFVSWQ